jgi:hypothetical protein
VILCDTGPMVAAFNAADKDHDRCVDFLARNWSRLVVPSLAVTEVCHPFQVERVTRIELALSAWEQACTGPVTCTTWGSVASAPTGGDRSEPLVTGASGT